MKILGIGWHLCSTVSLFVDDKITYIASEERFTRVKNDDSFPINALKDLLSFNKLKLDEIDYFAIASTTTPCAEELIKSYSQWSVKDYLKQQNEYWFPKIYKNKNLNELKVMKGSYKILDPFKKKLIKEFGYKNIDFKFAKNRKYFFSKILNVPIEKIIEVDHHTCHAHYSYFASSFKNEKILSLTLDGYGDGVNATVGIFDKNGKYKRVFNTQNCNLGRLYRYMTLVLGMKPNEHEYKVMGLAPYGKSKYSKDILKIFESTMQVKGINFRYKVKPKDYYFWFKKKLDGYRFDNIAYALQQYVENIISKWVYNVIKKFKIKTLVYSGGISLNVKANGKLLELKNLKKFFVAGAGGDESISTGAALYVATNKKIISKKNLHNLYLGPSINPKEEENIIKKFRAKRYKVIKIKSQKLIAKKLLDGKVLARCVDRMEFGPRSLGNRSILADPKNASVVNKINETIKNRDFWMPFAPIVLDKFAKKYLLNVDKIFSPHMTVAYKTKKIASYHMVAGLHPKDKTARAQILTKKINPKLYELINEFSKLTGRGCMLNTSFNLHGFPIVNNLTEAFYVMNNSSLDGLITDRYLILK